MSPEEQVGDDFWTTLLEQVPELNEWSNQQVRARLFAEVGARILNPFQSDEVMEQWRRNAKADVLIGVLERFGITEPVPDLPGSWQVSPSLTPERVQALLEFLIEAGH